MQSMQYTFRLFGGRKGQTGTINGHKFVHGICRKVVAPVQAASLIKVLSFYGAYAQGTPEYDAELAKEEGHGSKVPEAEGSGGAAEVRSDPGSAGAEPAEAPADERSGAADSPDDGTGSGAAGDGHGHAGVPKFEERADVPEPAEPSSVGNDDVAAAVRKLDPNNDDHWVKHGAAKGLPKLNAVEEAYGKAGLTRQDLEGAMPGWNRQKAIEAAIEG